MPHPSKIRVCTETEKKKAEIFNHIDDLIISARWQEALDYLQYLFRNAPGLQVQVNRKLAWLYYELKNDRKALSYFHRIIPSNDLAINRMVIECLVRIGEKNKAIWHIAKAPLTISRKRTLMTLIFPGDKKKLGSNIEKLDFFQINIRCAKCTRFLYFIQDKSNCLFCDDPI
ncbi:MAG: tetratricopeptide repeat protein [Candidatus Hodarchaeales archaeon]|jgi:tetratricopeptide (TPR) repeat protein